MRRSVAVLAAAATLVYAPAAAGWTWPVEGPVLRPFVFGDDPYAAGQHRGIDIGAAAGTTVRSAAAGTVSFAGTVPAGNRTVTVRTATGLSVTYLELGLIRVARGDEIGEGGPIGTIGEAAHVHFGVRVTDDPQGYLDPLRFLPVRIVSASGPEPAAEVEAEVAQPPPVTVKPAVGKESPPGETPKIEAGDTGAKAAPAVTVSGSKGVTPASPALREPLLKTEPPPRQPEPVTASASTPAPQAAVLDAPSTGVTGEAPSLAVETASVAAPREQAPLGVARATAEEEPPVRSSSKRTDRLVQTTGRAIAGGHGGSSADGSSASAAGRLVATGSRPGSAPPRSASSGESVSQGRASAVEPGHAPEVTTGSVTQETGSATEESDDPILLPAGLLALAILGAAGVTTLLRRRRSAARPVSPRVVLALPKCSRGRMRPARLIHACSRAGELGRFEPRRPRPLRELHRPLTRPKRRVVARVRV